MTKLMTALALLLGTSAYAEMEGTTEDTTETTMTSSTTNVSDLNYFVGEKKFNIDTTVGFTSSTTEITGQSDTDEDGLNFGITGLYGITNDMNIGFNVGYVSTEEDGTSNETTGLTDISFLYNWRFMNDTNTQHDLNFVLSPSLGATEEDGNETNGYRGSTLVTIAWVRNAKANTRTQWNVGAAIDYETANETENTAGVIQTEIDPTTDVRVFSNIRYHATEKLFLNGTVDVTVLPADIEYVTENGSPSTTVLEMDPAITLTGAIGYKVDRTSNLQARLRYATQDADVEASTATVGIQASAIDVAYVREF